MKRTLIALTLIAAGCSQNLHGSGQLSDGRAVQATAVENRSKLIFEGYQIRFDDDLCIAEFEGRDNDLTIDCEDGRTGVGRMRSIVGIGGGNANVVSFQLNDGTTGQFTHQTGFVVE